MMASLLCFLLLSPCPGGGAISVAWFMCSHRGTPILSDRQNNDIRLTEALNCNNRCMHDYVISCVWLSPSFWHHRFACVDQTVLFRQPSTAWATISSTSKHYVCQEQIRHKGCECTPSPLLISYGCVLLLQDGVYQQQHQLLGHEWEPSLQTSEDAGGWKCVSQRHRY